MPGGFGSAGFGTNGAGQLLFPSFEVEEPVIFAPWPATLPAWVRQEDYQEIEPDFVIRTPMDTGPAKQRPRFTEGPLPFVMSLALTWEQVEIFYDFYRVTLDDGALPFAWVNHRTGAELGYRFIGDQEPPAIQADTSGSEFIVQMILEAMT